MRDILDNKIIEHCQSQRKLYKNYLQSQNVVDANDMKYIVFDIGYRGTTAKAFNRMYDSSTFYWVYLANFENMYFTDHAYDSIVPNIDTLKYGNSIPILESLISDSGFASGHYFNEQTLVQRASEPKRLVDVVKKLQEQVIEICGRTDF